MTTFNKNHLLLLFDRPREPSFFLKGQNKVKIVIPDSYYTEKYQYLTTRPQILADITQGELETVSVKPVESPNLEAILGIKRNELFSNFVPRHRKIADKLVDVFMDAKDVEELFSKAVYARDRVNPQLFHYAFSVALLHRPDTKDLILPSLVHFFPYHFIHQKQIAKAREMNAVIPDEFKKPIEIPLDYTATDLELEHRIAYFREDIGVCLHHWQWHLVYPHSAENNQHIARKDRRGELFYYMHHQIIARYNFERLSNKLHRVERLIDWNSPIEQAYFPKLHNDLGSGFWPGRVQNQKLKDVHRDDMDVDVNDLRKWRDRIIDAIDARAVIREDGTVVQLTKEKGIDILGDVIESSIFSPNASIYGDLHNMGHVVISAVDDPDNRYLEHAGVMGYTQTAMRDPLFYRWHAFIDDIFQSFKLTLPSYNIDELSYPKVSVTCVEIHIDDKSTDILHTFWKKSTIDISGGIDFAPRGKLEIKFPHLDHSPFSYNITVNNETGKDKTGTCRIFLSPKLDEKNAQWNINDQRLLFVELDKFVVQIRKGTSTISRKSSQSSVTIPFQQIFRDIEFPPLDPDSSSSLSSGRVKPGFCGCGWPEYMLLPKGTADGMPCDLFVMISNYDDDKVDNVPDLNVPNPEKCVDAPSYCGTRDKNYPDRRAMGFPFDRKFPKENGTYLRDFLTPNMKLKEVMVQFKENRE